MTWEPIETLTIAEGLFFRFERIVLADEDGHSVLRDVIRHPGGVSVLPVQGDTITLIKQYRIAVASPLLEAPAGKLEPGEEPRTAAKRECEEEVGLEPLSLIEVGGIRSSPGFTDEIIHLYIADAVRPVPLAPDGLEERDSEIVTMTIDEAMAAVDAGEITDAKTRVLLLTAARLRSQGKLTPSGG